MTTAITIDAHAGWDIEVTTRTEDAAPDGSATYKNTTFVVKAGTKHTEYIWGQKTIVNIKELPA